jgi:hypothetical protein
MAEAPALHGSTALWALTPTRGEGRLRLVRPTAPERTASTRPRVPRPSRATTASATSSISSSPHAFLQPRTSAWPDGSAQPRTSTQRSAERPLTLTRRGRFVLVGLPIALGVAALILLGAFLTSQAQAGESLPAPSSTVEVSVAAGESLWDLAVRYAPERDPRDVVAEMVELNDLRGSIIQAGQTVAIPAAG